ncbi:signal peptidase II [Trichothermofontia sichuanensis B231]|uniref:signal peptidase II n=1 Tax=Trichothermofontia sichuanensis TaxID=3045816 RepID=UPI00224647EE|nr:signal peptidase II [Trichothermofontia sichuanensis]UZQ53964.1 signal peptidase II [Trichothermofontia sichuanensis B231]
MRVKNRLFWMAAIVSVVLDQLSKFIVVHTFDLHQTLPLWPGVFHLTYVTNTGAAFSLFKDAGHWLRWLSLGVSLLLMALATLGPVMQRWEQAGYGLILGGAIGNGIDRFLAGEVVDFLDFRLIQFPVFNLADVSINLGIFCLIIAGIAHSRSEPPRVRAASPYLDYAAPPPEQPQPSEHRPPEGHPD